MRSDLLTKLMAIYAEMAEETLKRMRQGGQAAAEPPHAEPVRKGEDLQHLFQLFEPGEREAQAARIEAALEQLQAALGGSVSSPTEGIRFRQCQVRVSATDVGTRAARVPRRVTISDADGVVFEMTDENEVILNCAGKPERLQDSLRLLSETMAMATSLGIPYRTTLGGNDRQTSSAPIAEDFPAAEIDALGDALAVSFRKGDQLIFELCGDQVSVLDDPGLLKPALELALRAFKWLENWVPKSPIPLTRTFQGAASSQKSAATECGPGPCSPGI